MTEATELDSSWQETVFGRVPREWSYEPLENFFVLITYGFTNPMPTTGVGPYMLTAKDIFNGKIQYKTARRTTSEAYEKLLTEKSRPKFDDILITKDGSIGRVAIVDQENICISQSVALIRPNKRILPLFLKYLLESDQYQQLIDIDATGSTIQHIYITKINKMMVAVPDNAEQKTIAAVLSSLDDKIDLLHRQNQTLEAIATTLFRQWFMEEAREDWEERPLSRIANFLNGLACQKHPPKSELEKLPVLKIKELSGGVSESSDWASSEIKPEYIVEAGDVIFAWSASLMVKVWDGERCVLNQHLFKVTSTEFPKWFYLIWCKHHLAEFISISSSHATTMGHIKRGDLDAAIVSVPPEKELKAMSEQMAPLLDKQISISKQIRILEKLRDNLLPKLMSGEVRVSNEGMAS